MTSVTTKDVNTNGFIDQIVLNFAQGMIAAEPERATGPNAPGIWVEGYSILTPMAWDAPSGAPSGTPKSILTMSIVEKGIFDTGATPLVTYNPGAGTKDLKTSVGTTIAAWDTPATDGAGAVLVGVTAKDYGENALFGHVGDQMWLKFTEPVSVTGATPADRWVALERAITFTVVGGTACADGTGLITDHNFPRPQGATDDPIISPAAGARSSSIHIKYGTGNEASNNTHLIPGIPAGCVLGVHLDPAFRAGIRDVANTAVAPLTDAARKKYVYPADAGVASAVTSDVVGVRDGRVDSVAVTFDLPIEDSTVQANLGSFAVSVDGATVPVTSWDTGSTANDTTINLWFGQTFPGGGTSRVVYTRDATCGTTSTGSTGAGVKAFIFPLGSNHRACLGTLDHVATDGVAPVVLSAATVDRNENGIIDGADVTFTEAITAGSVSGWTIDGKPVTAFASTGPVVNLTVAEDGLGSGVVPVAYAAPETGATTDEAGNGIPTFSLQATDGVRPLLTSATVRDLNGDGNLDSADFTFSEPVTTGPASAFSIGTGVGGTLTMDGPVVKVGFSGVTGTGAQDVAFDPPSNTFADATGQSARAGTFSAANVTDAAAPIATIEISPNAPVGPGTTTIRGVFTEAMDTSTAPTVTFAGKTLSGAFADGGTAWEGTVQVAPGDCTTPTGCEVTASIAGAKDVKANPMAAAATRTTEIDTIAPAAPASFSFVATPQAPAGYVNAGSTGISLTFPVTPGDAGGGTAALIVDGKPVAAEPTKVDQSQSSVTAVAAYASKEALAAAIAAGEHVAGLKLCDDAKNCTTVASAAPFTADYTAIPVALTNTFDQVLAGGAKKDLTWNGEETATDLADTTLSFSSDGTTFTPIATGLSADGSYSWTVPSVDTTSGAVRVTAEDKAGNTTDSTSQRFTVDSAAPVVALQSPTATRPFLGATETIRWTATDATIDQVKDPIQLDYSLNGGATWLPINGGSYSRANDGVETWTVPNVKSLNVRVRLIAVDVANRAGTAVSQRLASDVRGFVVARGGSVYGFGASSTNVRETMISKGDVVRGVAVRPDERSGYVLASDGRVYPFAESGATLPARPSSTRLAAGTARGITLSSATRGYVVDAYGRISSFGGAPRATASRTWVGKDLARGIIMAANNRGGYVLDASGRLHPFKVGRYAYPRAIQARGISSGRAVAVTLRAGERSGYILENTGRLLRFGGAPSVANPGISSRAGAIDLVPVTSTGGYWVDSRGGLHPYGQAFGAPANQSLPSGYARGAN